MTVTWQRPMVLELGRDYYVTVGPFRTKCRFIKPTKYGYNFLNIGTSTCVLKQHIYKSKKENLQKHNYFFLTSNYKIEKV